MTDASPNLNAAPNTDQTRDRPRRDADRDGIRAGREACNCVLGCWARLDWSPSPARSSGRHTTWGLWRPSASARPWSTTHNLARNRLRKRVSATRSTQSRMRCLLLYRLAEQANGSTPGGGSGAHELLGPTLLASRRPGPCPQERSTRASCRQIPRHHHHQAHHRHIVIVVAVADRCTPSPHQRRRLPQHRHPSPLLQTCAT